MLSELSSGPHLPVRACSRTPPPGGDSTPPPGVGYGDGASERQSASGRAGFGEQGEGTSTEGQRPRRTGILNLPVNVFCVITDIVCFFKFYRVFLQLLALKEQLDQETRRRQAYFNHMLQPGV